MMLPESGLFPRSVCSRDGNSLDFEVAGWIPSLGIGIGIREYLAERLTWINQPETRKDQRLKRPTILSCNKLSSNCVRSSRK
jgi:hypothetical protein